MPHVIISSKCSRNGLCIVVCPVEVIGFKRNNANWPKYYIDPEDCIDCGACIAECPNKAIFDAAEIPEEFKSDIENNSLFFKMNKNFDNNPRKN